MDELFLEELEKHVETHFGLKMVQPIKDFIRTAIKTSFDQFKQQGFINPSITQEQLDDSCQTIANILVPEVIKLINTSNDKLSNTIDSVVNAELGIVEEENLEERIN